MWGHMDGWGGWGPGWAGFAVGHVLWWLLVVVVIVLVCRWIFYGRRSGHVPPAPDSALELLRQRYARGEIDQQEFEERKRVLGA